MITTALGGVLFILVVSLILFLLGFLGHDIIKDLLTTILDFTETKVLASHNGIDNITIIPIANELRLLLDLPEFDYKKFPNL